MWRLFPLNSHRLLLPGRKENKVPYTLQVLVARCVCAVAEAENKIKRAKILIALLLKLKLYISLREGQEKKFLQAPATPYALGHNGAFLIHIIFLCLSLIVGVVLACSSQVKMKQEIASSQIRVLPLVSACEQDYVVKCVR